MTLVHLDRVAASYRYIVNAETRIAPSTPAASIAATISGRP